jgi:regulator of replication initiation timing
MERALPRTGGSAHPARPLLLGPYRSMATWSYDDPNAVPEPDLPEVWEWRTNNANGPGWFCLLCPAWSNQGMHQISKTHVRKVTNHRWSAAVAASMKKSPSAPSQAVPDVPPPPRTPPTSTQPWPTQAAPQPWTPQTATQQLPTQAVPQQQATTHTATQQLPTQAVQQQQATTPKPQCQTASAADLATLQTRIDDTADYLYRLMDGRMTVLSDRFDLELANTRQRCTELETQLTNTIERNAVLEREMANMRERVERLEEANMRDRGETQREMANMRERVERLEEANMRDRGETQQDMANGDPQQWRQEGGARWGWRGTEWSQ